MNYFNYYTEIEDTFIRRRGKHLLLSPMDWALIESWKRMGVPLHIALRGIEQSFDSHASSRTPRLRSVKSLLYCQEEVEAQFAEWVETRRGASDTPFAGEEEGAVDGAKERPDGRAALPFPRATIALHLAESHTQLAQLKNIGSHNESTGREGAFLEAVSRATERLAELATDFNEAAQPNAEQLEASLTAIEELLDRALRESLPSEELETRRKQAEQQLRPYRSRMERSTYDQTLDNLLSKSLREERGIPRLSLFYL